VRLLGDNPGCACSDGECRDFQIQRLRWAVVQHLILCRNLINGDVMSQWKQCCLFCTSMSHYGAAPYGQQAALGAFVCRLQLITWALTPVEVHT